MCVCIHAYICAHNGCSVKLLTALLLITVNIQYQSTWESKSIRIRRMRKDDDNWDVKCSVVKCKNKPY